MAPSPLGIRQFRQDECLSYLIFDRTSRQAMAVDPCVGLLETYVAFAAENGLMIRHIVDTRLHVDHLSASHLLCEEQRRAGREAEIWMSARTSSARPTRRAVEGDQLSLSDSAITVLETPGASEDGISLLGPGWILTGDVIRLGASSRTDLPGADAAMLWRSAHRILESAPSDSLILPSHDDKGILFSTVEMERRRNPVFLCVSARDFIEQKSEERLPRLSEECLAWMRLNGERYAQLPEQDTFRIRGFGSQPLGALLGDEYVGTFAVIRVDKFQKKLEERPAGTLFIDVREEVEFQEKHIPGMENIPLQNLGLALPKLRHAKRIYLSCLSGLRSALAAKTLAYVGIQDVVCVDGGMKAWIHSGFPLTEKIVD